MQQTSDPADRTGSRGPVSASVRVSKQGSQEVARVTGSEAWGIVNRIIAAMLIYGGGGWLLGSFLGSPQFGLAVGTLLGVGLATYTTMVRVSSLSESHSPIVTSGNETDWSRRMTQIRIRNAREISE